MAVEIGSFRLEHLTSVAVHERARLARLAVPGLDGDLTQDLGRGSVAIDLRGIFYGPEASDQLQQLRGALLDRKPLDFLAEAVGKGYVTRVLIDRLEISQRAGAPDQLDFACLLVEYVEPPEPVSAASLAGIDSALAEEAAGLVDRAQNALAAFERLQQADQFLRLQACLGEVKLTSLYEGRLDDQDQLSNLGSLTSER